MHYSIAELQQKILTLREQWKNSAGVDRKVIEIRGKLLKMELDKRTGGQQTLVDKTSVVDYNENI